MSKILTIPLILLTLFSGIRINIASHYCNGAFIASKVSLSGKLANCGMDIHSIPGKGINATHTCSDNTYSYSVSSNYVPSSPETGDVLKQTIHPVHITSLIDTALADSDNKSLTCNGPPVNYSPNKAAPEVICVFRI